MSSGRRLWNAAEEYDWKEVTKILTEHPEVDVNHMVSGWTTLHYACFKNQDQVLSLLLAHPGINVNSLGLFNDSPFLVACQARSEACIRLLLKDPRVEVNVASSGGQTPLLLLAQRRCTSMVKCWVASGKPIDLAAIGSPRHEREDRRNPEVAALFQRLKGNPEQTMHEMRRELGWYDEMAAEGFALVVFLSDGLLDIKSELMSLGAAARFFSMARRLPMELQMILCHRLVGSMGTNIPVEQREAAFGRLAKKVSALPRSSLPPNLPLSS